MRGMDKLRPKNDLLTSWLFLMPALLIVFIAVVIPLGNSVVMSFQKVRTNVPNFKPVFIGFDNYVQMFQDPLFIRSVGNTILFVLTSVSLELVFGVILAMMLSGESNTSRILRSIMLIPMIMAPVAAGTTWRMMFDKTTGVINYMLGLIGIEGVNWLGTPAMAFVSVVFVDVWRMTPWFAILLISGIKSISGESIEASLVDGATKWKCFIHIVLPQLKRVLVLVLMLRTIDAFKVFDIVYVMTGGGPGMATEMLPNYIYAQGLRYFNAGYAASLAIVFILAMSALSLVFIRLQEKQF